MVNKLNTIIITAAESRKREEEYQKLLQEVTNKGFDRPIHYSIYTWIVRSFPFLKKMDFEVSSKKLITLKFSSDDFEYIFLTTYLDWKFDDFFIQRDLSMEIDKTCSLNYIKINKKLFKYWKFSYNHLLKNEISTKIEPGKIESYVENFINEISIYHDIKHHENHVKSNWPRYTKFKISMHQTAIDIVEKLYFKEFIENKTIKDIKLVENIKGLIIKIKTKYEYGISETKQELDDRNGKILRISKEGGKVMSINYIENSLVVFVFVWDSRYCLKVIIFSLDLEVINIDDHIILESLFIGVNSMKNKYKNEILEIEEFELYSKKIFKDAQIENSEYLKELYCLNQKFEKENKIENSKTKTRLEKEGKIDQIYRVKNLF